MRAFRTAALITLGALIGCDGRDWEAELNAANARERTELAGRQRAELRVAELEALANEFQTVASAISSFRLVVAIDCRTWSDREPTPLRTAGTIAYLRRAGGSGWQLTDDMASPPDLETLASGDYRVTFSYRPEPGDTQSLLGHAVQQLAEVRTVELRLAAVLSGMGLELTPSGVTRLSVEVNGITVIEVANLGQPAQPNEDRFQALDASPHFMALPETYFAALRQRARERSAP